MEKKAYYTVVGLPHANIHWILYILSYYEKIKIFSNNKKNIYKCIKFILLINLYYCILNFVY
jgi:hypothetical protein